jgi:hypothetical protein
LTKPTGVRKNTRYPHKEQKKREVIKMTILIIILIYLIMTHVMNFISVACGCYLMDFEGLIENFFWPVLLPYALFRRFFLKK